MSSRCSICNLPEPIRAEVDRSLAERVASLSEIVEQFASRRFGTPKLSRSALDRHRRNCLARQHALAELTPRPEIAPQPDVSRTLALVESVRDRVEQLLGSTGSFLESAEVVGDTKSGLAAIREARKCLEVVGKITGELRADVACAVQINSTAPLSVDLSHMTVPQLAALRALTRLAHGEALDRVEQALLVRLEGRHA